MSVDPTGHSIFLEMPHEPWDGRSRQEVLDAGTGESLWSREQSEPYFFMGGPNFSADGSRIVLGSGSDTVEIVETRTGRIEKRLSTPARALVPAAGPDPDECLVATSDGELRRLSLRTGKPVANLRVGDPCPPSLTTTADGERSLVFGADDRAQILATRTLKPICELEGWWPSENSHGPQVRFSPDGEHLAGWNRTEEFTTWNTASGKREGRGKLEKAKIGAIDWSHDGRQLVVGDTEGTLQVFDARTGAAVGPRVTHPGGVELVRCSPTNDQFVTGGSNPVARVYEPGAEKPLLELLHEDIFGDIYVGDGEFSPDGAHLVTTTYSCGGVHCWDAKTGKQLWKFEYAGGNPTSMYAHFDRAGKRLCTYGQGDWTPRVVDAQNGETIVDLAGRGYGWVDFSADGTRLLASTGRSLQVLRAADGSLLFERVEMDGSEALLRSESMHVDGPPAVLRRTHVLFGGASYPLDSLAAVLLDPKRVRAAAAGVRVAPAFIPDPPTLALDSALGSAPVVSASCGAGLVGFEVEVDGKLLDPARVRGATRLEDLGRSARLDTADAGLGLTNGTRIRVCAVARSGVCSRPGFARFQAGPK
jgi:WD40 repeat protein